MKEDAIIVEVLDAALREVSRHVLELRARGEGRRVLGPVPGRPPEEDVEIEVDRSCQQIIERHLEATGLPLDVRSEHGRGWLGPRGRPASYVAAMDPFDGSGLFARGLPSEWWSVASIFRADGLAPVAGGAVDILRGELYLAGASDVTQVSLADGSRRLVRPSPRRSLASAPVVAAYLMDPDYLTEWVQRAGGLLRAAKEQHVKLRLWPNGGSCIYPWLANGTVDAYVMFNEPRSEIDPGLAFAGAAGLTLVEVTADGALAPYEFRPDETASRVGCFIAACTRALAEEIAAALAR